MKLPAFLSFFLTATFAAAANVRGGIVEFNNEDVRSLQDSGRNDCYVIDFVDEVACGIGKPTRLLCTCDSNEARIVNYQFKTLKDFSVKLMFTGKLNDCTVSANDRSVSFNGIGYRFNNVEKPDGTTAVQIDGGFLFDLSEGDTGFGPIPNGPSFVYNIGKIKVDVGPAPDFIINVTGVSGTTFDLCAALYN